VQVVKFCFGTIFLIVQTDFDASLVRSNGTEIGTHLNNGHDAALSNFCDAAFDTRGGRTKPLRGIGVQSQR
ncbi:hypothetical protein, partial [Antarctobacter heliothermus]|uniref:hypothetical protein n=1 Tax=Antarctobacter heliothermus TaxID=74033 RepID=UPI001BB071DD